MTAHPTEARRRTLLVALRRCYRLLERLDDPRITPDEDREIRRRLREEITPPVADVRPPGRRPEPARRGPDGDDLLRRDALHADPAGLPDGGRRTSTAIEEHRARQGRRHGRRPTPAAPGRDRRVSAPSSTGARGSAATGTATRTSPPRPRTRPCESMPTTCCTGSKPWRPVSASRSRRRPTRVVRRHPSASAWRMTPRTCPETDAPAAGAIPRRAVPAAAGSDRGAAAADARVPRPKRRRRWAGRYERPEDLVAELRGAPGARWPPTGSIASAWGELQDFRWQVRDVRLPPRVARGPPAQRGPPGRPRCRCGRAETWKRKSRPGRHRRRGPRHVP